MRALPFIFHLVGKQVDKTLEYQLERIVADEPGGDAVSDLFGLGLIGLE